MSELKPCPFCSGEADYMRTQASSNSEVFYYVFCKSCHARTGIYAHPKIAKAQWNRRVYR